MFFFLLFSFSQSIYFRNWDLKLLRPHKLRNRTKLRRVWIIRQRLLEESSTFVEVFFMWNCNGHEGEYNRMESSWKLMTSLIKKKMLPNVRLSHFHAKLKIIWFFQWEKICFSSLSRRSCRCRKMQSEKMSHILTSIISLFLNSDFEALTFLEGNRRSLKKGNSAETTTVKFGH